MDATAVALAVGAVVAVAVAVAEDVRFDHAINEQVEDGGRGLVLGVALGVTFFNQ